MRDDLEVLRVSLTAAVPLWMLTMRSYRPETLQAIAGECGQVVSEKGDVLQFRTKHKTAEAFNALAKGIAAMALVLGEVNVFGLTFRRPAA